MAEEEMVVLLLFYLQKKRKQIKKSVGAKMIEIFAAQKIQNFRTFKTVVQGAQFYRYSKWLCGS